MNNQVNIDMSGVLGNCESSKPFEATEDLVGAAAVSESTAVTTSVKNSNISYVGESFESIDVDFWLVLALKSKLYINHIVLLRCCIIALSAVIGLLHMYISTILCINGQGKISWSF